MHAANPPDTKKRNAWLLIGLLVVVLIAALPVLTYPLGRDQGEFATIGRGILNGRVPYVELWNPKPPAVFYVYAAAMALFGQTAAALRALDLLIVPPAALALYWLGSRAAGARVGLWAALLFAVFYFTETFWTLTQNDGLVLLPMTLAMLCAWKAAEKPRSQPVSERVSGTWGSNIPSPPSPLSHKGRGGNRQAAKWISWRPFQKRTEGERREASRAVWWALAAGALCGWVLWFKYPFALFVAAVAIAYVLLRRGIDWRVALAFVVGGLLTGDGGALYLASLGALDDLIESARVTSSYTALGLTAEDFGAALQNYVPYRWSQWGALFVLLAAWPVLWWRSRERDNGRVWLVVWLWLASGLAIMLVQAKGYDYHWLPMLPPLALLAAFSLERLVALLTRFIPALATVLRAVVVVALVAVLAANTWGTAWRYLTGQEDQMAYYGRFQGGEVRADETLEVVNFLRQRVVPGDSLFIWGFRPEVYYLSGLNPATRFIFQFPLVGSWYPPEWKEEAVDILWAAMPPYALVLQVDYMPWVTGRDADSNTLLQEYTELNNWLIANYERETQIGNFFVWRRKS